MSRSTLSVLHLGSPPCVKRIAPVQAARDAAELPLGGAEPHGERPNDAIAAD